MITGTTRLYAIIGDPIAHVRTPMAFNDYFLARKIEAVCLPPFRSGATICREAGPA